MSDSKDSLNLVFGSNISSTADGIWDVPVQHVGTTTNTGTIIKTAENKSPNATNNDVSLNDLSENSTYDISVNLIGSIHDLPF